MRGENQAAAVLDREFQRGKRLADARVFSDFAAFKRDVEIHADENALAAQFQIANGELVHGSMKMKSLRRGLKPRSQEFDQIAAAAGIAPLVVVPGQHLQAILPTTRV